MEAAFRAIVKLKQHSVQVKVHFKSRNVTGSGHSTGSLCIPQVSD